jgi:hypothetical protein
MCCSVFLLKILILSFFSSQLIEERIQYITRNVPSALRYRERARLSAQMAHSAIGSYSSDTGEMFRLHAACPVSSLIERPVVFGCD